MPQPGTLNPSVHRSITQKAGERSIFRMVPALEERRVQSFAGLIASAEKPQRRLTQPKVTENEQNYDNDTDNVENISTHKILLMLVIKYCLRRNGRPSIELLFFIPYRFCREDDVQLVGQR
jgi:hypothetical protein